VLDRTPFYAEGGGQLADGGRIELATGAVVEVRDVQSPIKGLIVHRAGVLSGEVSTGTAAHALVDIDRRRAISRAHTATHMVHKAIREALGDTATQAGSENAPGRFRFDFNAQSAVPLSVLSDVEAKVNALLLEDLPVHAEIMTQQEARDSGAMALFGEKYGDAVRVVSVGNWARELCGGTHAQRSGQLGLVKLLGEASIGSGVRRVEALVGTDAYDFLAREHAVVGQLTEALKVRPEELPERISSILGRLKDAEREITTMRQQQVLARAGSLVSGARDVFGVSFIGHDAGTGIGADDLRGLALDLRGRLGNDRPSVVAVAGVAKDRPVVIVATNDPARQWGVRAGDLVKVAAQTLGGGGGGKDDVAQGGGTDATKVVEALARVEHTVGERVTAGR
jgi:alanyl-tRNA synthetase